ncbi:MAG TPA: hypothetical protein VGR53_11295 [Nitrososphaerales archaeon]|nr:hypothetical protein [Nitrososphaerales archaeon]
MAARTSIAIAFFILVAFVTGFSDPMSASATSSPQVCVKQSSPVLNDTGRYTTFYPSMNFSLVSYSTHYEFPSVLKTGGTYLMWFSGAVHNISGIFTASSPDGMTWAVTSTPVLKTGTNGTWDSGVVYSPDVIWNGSMYLMYYTATGTGAYREVGLAYSRDNVAWVKYEHNPVLVAGPSYYDSWWGRFGSVIKDGSAYRMWYSGHTLTNRSSPWYVAIDYATSADGVHWTKSDANPVYGGGANWTSYYFEHPSVAMINGILLMVSGDGYQISYATSVDGTHWVGGGQILVGPSPGRWDNATVLYPAILVEGTKVMIWYTGETSTSQQEYFDGIGLASCFLITLSSTTTTTSTATVTTHNVFTSTTTVVSERTIQTTMTTAQSSGVPAYDISTVALGGLLAVALAALLLSRRKQS